MTNWKMKLKSVKGTEFEISKYKAVSPQDRFITNIKAQIALFIDPNADTKVKPTFIRGTTTDVKFNLKFGNTAVDLRQDGSDETSYVVAQTEFVDMLREILADAQSGVFDDQLNNISAKMVEQLRNARTKRPAATA